MKLFATGNVEVDLFDETQEYHSDIPGLASRAKNHLEFLGLYNTHYRASQRHDIPALKVWKAYVSYSIVGTIFQCGEKEIHFFSKYQVREGLRKAN